MAKIMLIEERDFIATDCARAEFKDSALCMQANPHSDLFNIPDIHVADNLGKVTSQIRGDFTLAADVLVESAEKFDAAGLYLRAGTQACKYVIENYVNTFKLVSVQLSPFSDEANGQGFDEPSLRLILTRKGQVFSFYYMHRQKLAFHRAIYMNDAPAECEIGFAVQAPFSSNVAAKVSNIEVHDYAIEDDIRE